jgi:hypothetical protein
MYKKVLFISIVIGFVSIGNIFSEELVEEPKLVEHVGFIFSSEDILLGLDDYNGGVGIKLLLPTISLRFMADFGYSNSADIISGDLGVTLEKRIREGRIIPYFGGGVQLGIERERAESDADNWTNQLTFPFSASGILGVEVFITEFLSVFAEYQLALQFIAMNTEQSVNGTKTESTNWNWDVGTGLGNSGRIGIVVYLDDVIEIDQE